MCVNHDQPEGSSAVHRREANVMDLDLPPDATHSKFQTIWGWMCDRGPKDSQHFGAGWTLTYHRMRYSAHSGASGAAPRDAMPRDMQQYSAPPGGRAGGVGGQGSGVQQSGTTPLCASSTEGPWWDGRSLQRRGQTGGRVAAGPSQQQQPRRRACTQPWRDARSKTRLRSEPKQGPG